MIEKMCPLNELECALEAVLFASGDSVSEGKLCAVLQTEKQTLRTAAQNLADYYDFNRRGLKLLRLDDRYQLASRADYAQMVRSALETRKPQSLTPAALEVLAIVAYKQPVTKIYIEQVRGVDSTYTLSSLVDNAEAVAQNEVADAEAKQMLTDSDTCRACAVDNRTDVFDILLNNLQSVENCSRNNDSSTVLVVVENGDVTNLL